MSLVNGDKSRSHRERKQNIHRRTRTRELLRAEEAKRSQASKKVEPVIQQSKGQA